MCSLISSFDQEGMYGLVVLFMSFVDLFIGGMLWMIALLS